MKPKKLVTACMLLGVMTLLFGCADPKKSKEVIAQKSPITLRVVTNESLRDVATPLLQSFQKQMSPERLVRFENTILPGYSDADQIATGEQKNDFWITPSLFAPAWSDQNLENLGAKQKKCASFGMTPIKVITTLELVSRVCDQERGCLWDAVMTYLQQSGPPKKNSFGHVLMLASPMNGPVESLAWANLFHWEGVNVEGEISKAKEKGSLRWLGLSSLVLPSYQQILERLAKSQPEEHYITIAPEAELGRYLKTATKETKERLIPLPLSEAESFSQELGVCISSGDWVTREKYSVLSKFLKFLRGKEAKSILKSHGYKTPPKQGETADPLQLTITNPSLRGFAEKSWKDFRKPTALVLAMDTSASLEEHGKIYDLKRVMRMVVAAEPEDSIIALMTFSSKPKLRSKFNTSKDKVLKALDRAKPIGGSAVYDALAAAFELLETAPKDHMKRLLFVTDGGDINSRLLKDQVVLLAKRRAAWRNTDFVAVGLKAKGADLNDIKEIAESANGRYIEVPSTKLDDFIKEFVSS